MINEYGFGPGYGDKPPNPNKVELCKQWLQINCEHRKSFNKDHTSYGFKHIVEAAANEYIPNGAFIQAAEELHYEYRRLNNGPNAEFKLGLKPSRKYWLSMRHVS